MSTYYEVLGVEPDVSHRDIERRYRALAKQFHPDLNPDADPMLMEAINEAWEVLGDPYRRAHYDRLLDAHAVGRRHEPDYLDLSEYGFEDWRGVMPRVVSAGRNIWSRGASSIEPLRRLPPDSVWGLHLAGTGVDDTDVSLLAAMGSLGLLRVLDLSQTAVTDLGLRHVSTMTQLEDLGLWGTAVTDAGAQYLSGLQRLISVNLGSTRVTDVVVDVLLGLPALRMVNLRSTAVTAQALVRLAALPRLELVGVPRLSWRDRLRVGRVLRNRLA